MRKNLFIVGLLFLLICRVQGAESGGQQKKSNNMWISVGIYADFDYSNLEFSISKVQSAEKENFLNKPTLRVISTNVKGKIIEERFLDFVEVQEAIRCTGSVNNNCKQPPPYKKLNINMNHGLEVKKIKIFRGKVLLAEKEVLN